MKFTFDSVVFSSNQLDMVRGFYETKLGFSVGVYEKNGEQVPDCSDSYVNYHINGGIVGFEREQASDLNSVHSSGGDLVIRVSEFEAFKEEVKRQQIPILKESNFFFMINDPEGRVLIFERS